MTGLVEFLRARLDEDEHVARRAGDTHPCWTYDRETFTVTADGSNWSIFARQLDGQPICDVDGGHVTRWDPARVLAEVEVKRRIMDLIPEIDNADRLVESEWGSGPEWATIADRLLRLMAVPYADHPDCDPAWTIAGVNG